MRIGIHQSKAKRKMILMATESRRGSEGPPRRRLQEEMEGASAKQFKNSQSTRGRGNQQVILGLASRKILKGELDDWKENR